MLGSIAVAGVKILSPDQKYVCLCNLDRWIDGNSAELAVAPSDFRFGGAIRDCGCLEVEEQLKCDRIFHHA
jgi:hypothetical protein